jgi:VanZ family protein
VVAREKNKPKASAPSLFIPEPIPETETGPPHLRAPSCVGLDMILETFTKRQKRIASAGKQDVFQYDDLPAAFRGQVIHIWQTAIGQYFVSQGYSSGQSSPSNQFWRFIQGTLAREMGVSVIAGGYNDNPKERCIAYLHGTDTLGALDVIELSFRVIDLRVRKLAQYHAVDAGIEQDPDDAIEELNHRFREHAIGYQYLGGNLVRLDSQFAHAEIVKPALALLNGGGFDGPADEFMQAFDHYRHGRNKEAVADALKAFESTMESICAARKWAHPPTATAKQLMEIIFANGLVPPMLDSHFSALRAAMESGLPTIRNKTSGHGQGPAPVELPAHFAAYALHLTASNIVFLVEANRALK